MEVATRVVTRMYETTSSTEVAHILRRVEEAKAAYLVEMAKAGKSKGKTGMGVLPKAAARRKPRKELPGKSLSEVTLAG